MAERQAAHRHEIEAKAVQGKLAAERLGQILAFLVAMTAVGGGIWLISQDRNIQGLASIIGALGMLTGTFVFGRYRDAKERQEKRAELASQQMALPYDSQDR